MRTKKAFISLSILLLGLSISACSTNKSISVEKSNVSPNTNVETTSNSDTITKTDNFLYANYSEKKYNELLGKEKFALFFHSKSCSTCRGKSAEIQEKQDSFPENTTVLKVEFDDAPQSLKKKFKVVKYDTFIIFNDNGDSNQQKAISIDKLISSLSI
jgi:thiol-disulfide isomerase/thioredoxin